MVSDYSNKHCAQALTKQQRADTMLDQRISYTLSNDTIRPASYIRYLHRTDTILFQMSNLFAMQSNTFLSYTERFDSLTDNALSQSSDMDEERLFLLNFRGTLSLWFHTLYYMP